MARRGGKPIPRKGWDPFFPPRLGLPTQHSQRPLKGMGPLLPICAPALSQAILSEVLGRRPGRNGLSAASSAKGQGLRTLAFASFWQTGHFAAAIWKFLSGFALEEGRCGFLFFLQVSTNCPYPLLGGLQQGQGNARNVKNVGIAYAAHSRGGRAAQHRARERPLFFPTSCLI